MRAAGTTRDRCRTPPGGRRGIVLLAVLVVVTLLTLAAYEFSELMLSEYRAAESARRAAQARALADSGVHYAAAMLSSPDALAGNLPSPIDNAQLFQGILAHPDPKPRFQGRFSVLALTDPDDPSAGSRPYRFGVTDESGRINLNALMQLDSSGQVAHDMLLTLPNMTEDVANAILDWIDADSDTRTNGAEDDYYSTLSPPYHCKNGPLDSLEELLLVKGVTPQLLYGNDRNRNGVLDPGEDDGQGVVDRGWSAYLTAHSRELNVDSQGNPRIYVNDSDLQGLYNKLNTAVGQDLAAYIIAYRQYGPMATASGSGGGASGGGSGGGKSAGASSPASGGASGGAGSSAGSGTGSGGGGSAKLSRNNLNFRQSGRPRSIASLFELVNSSVSIPTGTTSSTTASTSRSGNGQTTTTVVNTTTSSSVVYASPLNDPGQLQQLLPLLLDSVTTTNAPELPARVNVNTAPQTVLSALPGLTSADVQAIVQHRPDPSAAGQPDPVYQSAAWLITEASFPAKKLQSLEKYITARSQVYRVQSVGTFDGGGPTARVEAVIDTNAGRPRILYYRDLTQLGKGFDLSPP